MAKDFVDYLTAEDVANVVATGVLWRDLQGRARDLAEERGKAIRAQVPIIMRKAQIAAQLAELDRPKAPPSPFGIQPLSNPLNPAPKAPAAPAKGKGAAKAGASIAGFKLPENARLLEPGTDEALKAREREATQAALDATEAMYQGGEARIAGLQAKRDKLLTDGLESAFYEKYRARTVKGLLPKVLTHWPELAKALAGKVDAKFKMENDIRLLANALGSLAAEVGVLFAPIDEMPSTASRSAITGRPFGNYDEPHYAKNGRLIPHGAGPGNKVYNPMWAPEFGLTREEWFMVQDAMTGDEGARFKGRGFIQLTGRGNYAEATKRLGGVFKDLDLVSNPELVNDARFAYAIFAAWLKTLEKNILAALKKGDLTAARSWVNAGNGAYKTPNGLEEFTGAWRAAIVLFIQKIEAKTIDADDAALMLAQMEETDQAMRAAEAKAPAPAAP